MRVAADRERGAEEVDRVLAGEVDGSVVEAREVEPASGWVRNTASLRTALGTPGTRLVRVRTERLTDSGFEAVISAEDDQMRTVAEPGMLDNGITIDSGGTWSFEDGLAIQETAAGRRTYRIYPQDDGTAGAVSSRQLPDAVREALKATRRDFVTSARGSIAMASYPFSVASELREAMTDAMARTRSDGRMLTGRQAAIRGITEDQWRGEERAADPAIGELRIAEARAWAEAVTTMADARTAAVEKWRSMGRRAPASLRAELTELRELSRGLQSEIARSTRDVERIGVLA